MDSEKREELRREELVEGKLTKVVYKEGEGELPTKGQEVYALYRGTLENGSEFDSNQNRDDPFKFTLGQGMVIKGWDEGFASMRRGEQATLICSPEYAYGARGSPPRIPPNSTLHFEVELIDFQDKKKEKWEMSTEQKVQIATRAKQEGNDLLKNGKYSQAAAKYTSGIEQVADDEDEAAKNILKVLRMNLSQACINAKRFAEAIDNCTKVLKVDDKNIKTLYRRSVAYSGNQEFDKARDDVNKILELDPNNQEAKQQLSKITVLKKNAEKKEKKLFGSMFSKSGLYEDKKPKEKKSKVAQKQEESSEEDEMPELEKDQEADQEAVEEKNDEKKDESGDKGEAEGESEVKNAEVAN